MYVYIYVYMYIYNTFVHTYSVYIYMYIFMGRSCFGMTEPGVASSDPTQLQSSAVRTCVFYVYIDLYI